MNLIELLFFLSAVFLSVVFGRYFFKYIGWWGAVPGADRHRIDSNIAYAPSKPTREENAREATQKKR
jgi:hypothetical protein